MTEEQCAPRKTPCASCPYRKNVPSGIWHDEEYAKLERYDVEMAYQPPALFMCHQAEGDICSGWFAHKDPFDLLAVRLALSRGVLDVDVAQDYSTTVPLFASGHEAAQHGTDKILAPDERAVSAIEKIVKKRGL